MPALTTDNGNKTVRFQSFGGLVDYSRSIKQVRYPQTDTTNFFGGVSREQAHELAANGWQAGYQVLAVALPDIKPRLDMQAGEYYWGVTGDFFDIGAVLAGEPEHWLAPEQEPKRRVVRVVVNIGQLGDVAVETINRRGALTSGLVLALEELGFVVELEAVSYARVSQGVERGKRCKISFPLGTTPLDMLELAYISGHPTMLRHLLFGIREQFYPRVGHGGDFRTEDLPERDREEGCIYIGCGGGRLAPYAGSDQTARAWIDKQIAEQARRM